MLDLQQLTSLEWIETAGLGRLDFGCVPLGPSDFDRYAASLFGLVAGAGADSAAPQRDPTPADFEQMQIICCLTVRKAKRPGEDASDLRLVLAESDEQPDAGRVWVGRLPVMEVSLIAGKAMVKYVEAAQRAARFRQRSETPAHAGRNGETLRTDTRALSPESE